MKYSLSFRNLLLASLIALCSGCQDYEGPMAMVDASKVLQEFNFELSHNVSLDIDYGELSARAYIEVYEENPLANATEDDQTPQGTPIYTTFLDEDGSFHGKMNIPTCVSHVYVYSPSWGTPMLKDCKIINNRAVVSNTPMTWPTTRSLTRAGEESNYTIRELTKEEATDTSKKFYTINGGWDVYGKTKNENGIIDGGTLDASIISAVQQKLWNGNTSKVKPFANEKYAVDNVNVEIQKKYEKDGKEFDVTSAKVWFTMLTEAAWNENSFGYYYYDKNNASSFNINTIEKYIIIPNVSISNEAPFGIKGNNFYWGSYAPVHTNMRFQLLYKGADGRVSTDFPPGTEIGFFVLQNAFAAGSINGENETIEGIVYNTRKTGKIKTNSSILSSNKNLQEQSRYIALQLQDNSLVYGVEDGALGSNYTGYYGDRSYDDMLFTITANPNLAIKTDSDLPQDNKVENPVEDEIKTQNFIHTYAYEDIWPKGGDYDLNDVVVEHKRTYKYSSHFKFVTEVVDEFTFRSVADHRDGFAIHLDVSKRGTLTLPNGAIDETETGAIILTTDVSKVIGQTLAVKRELNGINKGDIDNEELNPFIINYTLSSSNNKRVEVHLPNHPITSKGMKSGEGNSDYYVNDQVTFPFAIRIPEGNFTLSSEGVRIDNTYPDYKEWTNSHGKNNKDWYKHPKTN